ncbi:glycosyltransferase family 2 protein [Aliarcobacter cryaerophilus]|uniref:glycosyltransferase family 2 protein n=1 Tax=Aliarcobacter cryaerophilus TaxID=28198 RepID=UPI0021B5751E|nr:glycosyltransferase family 2 protein [Aliarcobacter cryaerophilus]MCT7520066.1 glycosyltransferase family 2 protein [Aliarcobacter cryaerophilus]
MNINSYPLVSVIIPFYNHNQFIKKTLDSIIEDSYPNKEIVIINDGSTDPNDSNITQWIKDHKNLIKINYIKRENKGLTKTLNELVKISRGKYLLICASDDYLINNTVSKRVELLEEVEANNKLILISDNIVVDNNDTLLFESNLFEFRRTNIEKLSSDDGLKYSIIKQWSFAGPSWIANRKLFDEHNLYFDENLLVEDWDFFLRIIAKNYALFYNEKVSAYRWEVNKSYSNDSAVKRIQNDLRQTALKNSQIFEEPYKQMLLDYCKEEEKSIKDYIKYIDPIRWFRTRTKPMRYRLKRYFKSKSK